MVVSNKSGKLYAGYGFIDSTAASDIYYVQFFNSTAAPENGTAVSSSMPTSIVVDHSTGTTTPFDFNFSEANGVTFSTGITICVSTTQFTKTAAGNVLALTAFYK